jgi:hypothetical protein
MYVWYVCLDRYLEYEYASPYFAQYSNIWSPNGKSRGQTTMDHSKVSEKGTGAVSGTIHPDIIL